MKSQAIFNFAEPAAGRRPAGIREMLTQSQLNQTLHLI
jgi:hypothetical protein